MSATPTFSKEEVVALYRQHGLAEAHRRTGVAKTNIRRWADKAGVARSEVNAGVVARTEEATAAQAAARRARSEELRSDLMEKVMALAHTSVDAELVALQAVRIAQNSARNGAPIPADVMRRLDVLEHTPLRELTGARTRALHDLQLLLGEDTERGGANGPTVVFVQPPPVAARDDSRRPTIVQLPAADAQSTPLRPA